MSNFTREQRGQAFDSLPKDIKSVLTSDTLIETYRKIGIEHKLAIDKVGILADTVNLTILNLVPKESLVSKLGEELGLSSVDAVTLGKSINDEVFLKIREMLRIEQEKEQAEPNENEPIEDAESPVPSQAQVAPSLTEYTKADREDILAEIENPTPAVHPITVDTGGPAMQKEITPDATKSADAIAREFIAGRLTETKNLPSQATVIRLEPTLQNPTGEPPKPKGYPPSTVDPYREPMA